MDENGGAQNGQGDSDDGAEGKLCRDYMRNVCNRGSNCRFIHPNDIKIKTDPIFCHDYQQSKCFRSTCKFIHCSREDEEHFKQTGELPQDFTGGEQYRAGRPIRGGPKLGGFEGRGGLAMRGGRGGRGGGGRGWVDQEDPEIPICKDFLKGVCDRPPGGCKFRHVDESYGGGGGRGGMLGRRRMGGPGFYDEGPEAKRSYDGFGPGRMTEFEDYYSPEYSNPPPPPPPQSYGMGGGAGRSLLHGNGDGSFGTAMKAMEDENFMLKRRIEELKKQVSDLVATNEYLLSQNATLRLTNLQKDGQNASVGSLVSMAQPMGLTSSMSVSATQPLSTMSTMPTVSMSMAPVSMSQPLEAVVSMAQAHQSMSQAQVGYSMVNPQGSYLG